MESQNLPKKREWLFPDAYLPDTSDGVSHEAVCVLNLERETADIALTLYFEDREPLDGFQAECPGNRTLHIRLDKITNEEGIPIPRCVPYAIRLKSTVPIVSQYTRLDATKPAHALMTTMGV